MQFMSKIQFNGTDLIYLFLIGFLTNAILHRTVGNVPSDDIGFPIVIAIMLSIAVILRFFGRKHEQRSTQ